MKITHFNHSRRAFTRTELAVVVVLLGVGGLVFLLAAPRAYVRQDRIQCVDNLKKIGLAFRIQTATLAGNSSEGVEERVEGDIVAVYSKLFKELGNPRLLYCPADKGRSPAGLLSIKQENLSYFARLNPLEGGANSFLAGDRNLQTNGVSVSAGPVVLATNMAVSWSKEIHVEQGNILLGDGSVQQMSSSRLNSAVQTGAGTRETLVFP